MFKLHKNKTVDLGLCEIELTKTFTPHNICHDRQKELFVGVPESLKTIAREMLADDWRIFLVKQQRGRCYYDSKTITIPIWVMSHRDPEYKTYYIAHELAHAYTQSDNHGQLFIARLKLTCPAHLLKYEIEYKPTEAKKAGFDYADLGL